MKQLFWPKDLINFKKIIFNRGIIIPLFLFYTHCSQEKIAIPQVYEGPLFAMDSVFSLYSDSAIVRVSLESSAQRNFANGDEEYPVGLKLIFYDGNARKSSTFTANYVRYYADGKYYKGLGNVTVLSLVNGDELHTEELFWYLKEKKFKTDKFVSIKSEGEVHTGEGMEAAEDFSSYTILHPSGTLKLDQQ